MRTFVLLAETGSIQLTAERLPLTQPAVTRQIQRLETELGTTLLDRRVKPPRLTASGLAVLERCRAILGAVEELKASTDRRAEPEGPLRIGISNALSDTNVALALHAARMRFPKIEPRLTSGWAHELREAVARGKLDAAVILTNSGSQSADGLDLRTLSHEQIAIAAAAVWEIPRRPALAALASKGWVLNPEPCDARHLLAMALAQAGQPLHVVAEVQGLDLQAALIGQGLGLGLVPTRRLKPYLRRHALKMVMPVGVRFEQEIAIVRSPHLGRLDAAVDLIQDKLAHALRKR